MMTQTVDLHVKSFEFAQDLTKQGITLSTAVVTVTVSFFKDIFGAAAPSSAKIVLAIAWMLFILSIAFGVVTLMGLTGSLAAGSSDINGPNTRRPAILQHTSFLLALALTVTAAIIALP